MIYIILLWLLCDRGSNCNAFFNELILAKVPRDGIVRSTTKQPILNRLVTISFLQISPLLFLNV